MSAPQILATGRCLPARVVTNEDLSRTVDTNDQWVFSRTGIHQRHFCTSETGLDLAVSAARQAMDRAGIGPAHTAMLGDKLLTDVLGAKRSGVLALMVEPLGGPVGAWNRVLHGLQRPFKWAAKRRR